MDNSNEKLKLAEDLYNKVKFMSSPEAREMTLTLEQIFPELRESEDEKIRKAIQIYLDWLDGRKDYAPKGEYSIRDMISWLNKKKPVKLNEEDEKTRKDLIEFVNQYGDKFYGTIAKASAISWLEKQKSIDILDEEEKEFPDNVDSIRKEIDEAYQKGYNEGRRIENKDWLEKQGEQKPISSVWKYKKDNTPLLRDSFILNKYGCVDKSPSGALVSDVWVLDFDELAKLPKEEFERQSEQKSTDKVEPKFRNGQWIVWQDKCYKVNYNGCGYELVDQNGFSTSLEYGTIDENAHFWTIQDAKDGDVLCSGNPFIFRGFGDKRHPNNPTAYCGMDSTDRFILSDRKSWWTANKVNPATKEQCELLFSKMKEAGYEWDNKKKELKKIEQNTAWSEDDVKKVSNWLKSLKPNHWKPSKEQIEAMEYAAAYVDSKEDKEIYRTIKSLLDELKILRDYE